MADLPPNENKKKFDVDQLPVEVRKLIKTLTLLFLMLVIVAVWVPMFINTMSRPATEKDNELLGIGKEFGQFVEDLKMNIDPEKIEKTLTEKIGENEKANQELQDKMAEQLTINWVDYLDSLNHFSLKYPPDLVLATSTDSIFKLSPAGTSTEIMAIKKFSTYNNFANMNNIKKVIEIQDQFIVIFDYLNNTTTNLIFNTFKLIDNNL